MRNLRSPRLTLAVLAVAGLMLVAGGTAIASNMGFKGNLALVLFQPGISVGFQASNWIALPYNNPYATVDDFCEQTGLVGAVGGVVTKQGNNAAFITLLNGATGTFQSAACGFANIPIRKGQGIQVRQPVAGTGDPAPPASLIVVGSHDPNFSIDLVGLDTTPPINAQQGNYWFSVPYHTTASNLAEICTTSGLGPQTGFVTTLNPQNGQFSSCICEFCPTTALTLGRHVQIRDSSAPLSFIPAHF